MADRVSLPFFMPPDREDKSPRAIAYHQEMDRLALARQKLRTEHDTRTTNLIKEVNGGEGKRLRSILVEGRWFILAYAGLFGGPTIVIIAQDIMNLKPLADQLKWITAGAELLMNVLQQAAELLVRPLVLVIRELWRVDLTVPPEWKYAFIIYAIYLSSVVRAHVVASRQWPRFYPFQLITALEGRRTSIERDLLRKEERLGEGLFVLDPRDPRIGTLTDQVLEVREKLAGIESELADARRNKPALEREVGAKLRRGETMAVSGWRASRLAVLKYTLPCALLCLVSSLLIDNRLLFHIALFAIVEIFLLLMSVSGDFGGIGNVSAESGVIGSFFATMLAAFFIFILVFVLPDRRGMSAFAIMLFLAFRVFGNVSIVTEPSIESIAAGREGQLWLIISLASSAMVAMVVIGANNWVLPS